MSPTETYFNLKDKHSLKLKGWKKTFQTTGNQKKAEVPIPTSDFKLKMFKRDKEGHFIKGRYIKNI